MDIENLKSWASQPDVCRCCLSTSGSWDMLAAYLNEAGEKQVYSELLHSCFGISLSSLSEWGPGRLVCDLCVGRLHEAYTFKKQVVQAEEQFVSYINSRQETTKELKLSGHINSSEDQHDKVENINVETNITKPINEKISSYSELESVQKPLDKTRTRRKSKNACKEVSYTDVPDFEDNVDDIAVEVTSTVPMNHAVKLISERKRIKMTCDTILRDTTACPFRHHRSWFQCFFCTQAFMDISTLKTHTDQTHTNINEEINKLKRYPRSLQIDISELKCRICDVALCNVESLRSHFIDVHKLVVYKECIADYKVNCSPYVCHICGKQFHVFRTLTTHLNVHYANFICDVCGKSFLNSKRLKVHNRTHEKGAFPCGQCGKVLKTKTSKANHVESHSKRVIKCQICSLPMKHYNDRIKHMSEEHNITHKFKCPICAREYNIKHYLATHIRQTHGHKNKKCGECGMAFITNHGLKKHMQRHSGLKAYSCELCSKAYARSHSLREHMRVHDT